MDKLFGKFEKGYVLEFESNILDKNWCKVYNNIYYEIDKFSKDIVLIIMGYYNEQQIVFKYGNDGYTFYGNYINMFIYEKGIRTKEFYCHITINRNIGTHNKYGNECGIIKGYGETGGHDSWETNNNRKKNVKEFLEKIKKFCLTLHTESYNYGMIQLGIGYDINESIRDCLSKWKIKKCDLNNYYFVSKYDLSECIVELTKFEYECIVLELEELRDIICIMQL